MHQVSEITINLDVAIFKEDNYFIAYAPALELTAYGNSIKNAKKDFDETLNIFIKDILEKKNLHKVLLELGWTLKTTPSVVFKQPATKRKINQGLNLPYTQLINTSQESVSLPVY